MFRPPVPYYMYNWGKAIQIFTPYSPNFDIHYVVSVPRSMNTYSDEEKQRVSQQVDLLCEALARQPYYRAIYDWIYTYKKEVLYMSSSCFSVVSLARRFIRKVNCTMREVLCGHMLASSEQGHHRNQMIAVSLELHILNNVDHHDNIITVLSVDYSYYWDRCILFYELSMPLVYYVKERAFIGRDQRHDAFDDPGIPIYIVQCVANGLSHLVKYGIALGGQISDAVFINYRGFPKLGSFLGAKVATNNAHYQNDIAALGGFYMVLMNRNMPLDEIFNVVNDFPNTRDAFTASYHTTRDDFPHHHNPIIHGLFAPGTENNNFARRCLTAPDDQYDYFDIARYLGIDDVPSFHEELSEMFRNQATYFDEPMGTEQFQVITQPRLIQTWETLDTLITITVYDDKLGLFTIDCPLTLYLLSHPAAIRTAYTAIVTSLIQFDPNNVLPADDADLDDLEDVQPRLPFKPTDILGIYPLLVAVHNSFVYRADHVDMILGQANSIFAGMDVFLDHAETRALRIKMRGIDGVRHHEGPFVPDFLND